MTGPSIFDEIAADKSGLSPTDSVNVTVKSTNPWPPTLPPEGFDPHRPRPRKQDVHYAALMQQAAYLLPGENNGQWMSRARRELREAGYSNVQPNCYGNVAWIYFELDGIPIISCRGSEVKFGSFAAIVDSLKDWFRNLQALGWRRIDEKAVHRGFYAEARVVAEDITYHLHMKDQRPFDLLVIFGHSKSAAIGGVLSLMFQEMYSHCLLATCGEPRWIKRAGQLNPWQRPAWVDHWRSKVTHWRVTHEADPVSATPGVLRSCHTGDAEALNDQGDMLPKTERAMVRARLVWAVNELGSIGVKAATGGVLVASWQGAKLLWEMYRGSFTRHVLSSYLELTADNNTKGEHNDNKTR